jgi:manganese-dependent inorganic pyrophosphatase
MMMQRKYRTILLGALMLALLSFGALSAENRDPILVFGHKNPDTDTVMAAVAAAHLLTGSGTPAIACVQGEVNPETAYVLETFGVSLPANVVSVAGRRIGLVDFNEYPQGPEDIQKGELVFLVDHHRLGGMTSNAPMEAWFQPVGSTCTILHEMFGLRGVAIPKNIAGGMLAAILSDTVNFRSVTTTDRDRVAATELARIAGVGDMEALGQELFTVKSDFREASSRTLLLRDYKSYVLGEKKIGIGQIEALDIGLLNGRRDEFFAEMAALKKESDSFAIILMLTDITRNGAEILVLADDDGMIAETFSANMKDGSFWLDGVMSRKSQVIPPLERALEALVETR